MPLSPWYSYIICLTFFSPCLRHLKLYCVLKCGNCSDYLIPLPLLCTVIKLDRWKSRSNERHKIMILDNVTIFLSLLTYFDFKSVDDTLQLAVKPSFFWLPSVLTLVSVRQFAWLTF